MKRPKPTSTEPELITGTVNFAASATYTTSYALVSPMSGGTFPPALISRRDIVAVSIDDAVSGAPFPGARNLIPVGSIAPNGDLKIWLMNPGAAPVAIPDVRVNYVVLPGPGAYSPP
jgi:hypothetical protein